jgi:integrase
MLKQIPKTETIIFAHYKNLNSLRRTFERQRKRAAHKFGNPRLLRITFHTLRHWKGTTEYHKTKDILHVMKLLGHRNIKNTLLYTQLMDTKEDEYVCKIAETAKDIAQLIEDGFEFVCEQETLKFFRKRK